MNGSKTHNRPRARALACTAIAALALSAGAYAHSSNPNHLDSRIQNPFAASARITSAAPVHHTPYYGDLALDVVLVSGDTKSKPVYFRAVAVPVNNYVRGRVRQGGSNSPLLACSVGGYDAGGYVVEIEVQVRTASGAWTPVGWVRYAHLTALTKANGAYINSGEVLGYVSARYKLPCSSAPHVHMEFYNYTHFAGYVPRSVGTTLSTGGGLGCVGGSRSEDQTC